MVKKSQEVYYSHREERLNIYTHAFGFVISCIGTIFLMLKTQDHCAQRFFSMLTFGVSLCLLYLASTLYHITKNELKRSKLRIFDHAAIYVLIAGTYTPFTLLTLDENIGMYLFIITWFIALVGICLKLFFTGRFDVLSTILYVAMGWLVIVAYKPLSESLAMEGLLWLFAGGIAYTLGAIIYSISRIPFNHAIFHVFVLIGSFCHYWCIYHYV